jgi:hypothetical protein
MDRQDHADVSASYLRFANEEVRGRSALYDELARGVAEDSEIINFLLTLRKQKRQPNLLLTSLELQVAGTSFGTASQRTRALFGRLC